MRKSPPKQIPEIELHVAPWVAGTRADAYYGTVVVEFFLPDPYLEMEMEKAAIELLEGLQLKAYTLGANAIVALEVTLDPFALDKTDRPGLRLHAMGTACKLIKTAW